MSHPFQMFGANNNAFHHIAIPHPHEKGIATPSIDISCFTVVATMGHPLMDGWVDDNGHQFVFLILLQRLRNGAQTPLARFFSQNLSGLVP